ncbi:hypothetical protein OIU85_003420 [Salix viminalis]|uniref:Uncharacterized protein n=1 Tax=Salix viminalis TaxID=40686 RepID=A0A9Q0T1J8_SALVM|nr:hypothetical protein OIU85_003420 [Salix viminalis]
MGLRCRGGRWKERDDEVMWATVVGWGGNDAGGWRWGKKGRQRGKGSHGEGWRGGAGVAGRSYRGKAATGWSGGAGKEVGCGYGRWRGKREWRGGCSSKRVVADAAPNGEKK